MQVWTIGHSSRPWDAFVALLEAHRVEAIADVRRFPGSRKHPHFSQEALKKGLNDQGIVYMHFPELGGRRPARPDSHNVAWRNDAFRGYADYMETPAFEAGMQRFLALAGEKRTALMCAEAVWWRCHRGLISDWLKVRGVEVLHVTSAEPASEHPYTAAAAVVDGRLSYAGEQATLF